MPNMFTIAIMSALVPCWIWLALDCRERKVFWPLLGLGSNTRHFWLLSFLCFNPAQMLLYYLLVRRGKFEAVGRKALSLGVYLTVLLLMLLTYHALSGFDAGRQDAQRNAAGMLEADNPWRGELLPWTALVLNRLETRSYAVNSPTLPCA